MPLTPYIKQVQATRIKKEIVELQEKNSSVISITKVGTKDCYNVKFRSDHPLFSGTALTLNIDMAGDYPFRPPSIRFAHELYHPNVDRSGDLCIPILCFDNWKPATTLGDILTSVLLILGEPDLSRAIRIEIADEFVNNPTAYKQNVANCMKKIPT